MGAERARFAHAYVVSTDLHPSILGHDLKERYFTLCCATVSTVCALLGTDDYLDSRAE